MIKNFIVFVFIQSVLFFPITSSADQFTVVRVYDGDTLTAVGNDQKIRVRLVGIDAPETSSGKRQIGQPYSQRSKKFLAGLVLNKLVEIKSYGLDRYGRILGIVYVDGKNINLEMIKTGLAEAYRGKPAKGFNKAPYQQAEEQARSAGVGMWTLGEDYISPRTWRKIQKEKGKTSITINGSRLIIKDGDAVFVIRCGLRGHIYPLEVSGSGKKPV